MEKKYVKVLTEIDECGKKTPRRVIFEDKEYEIDRVLDVKKCASMKVGGVGERYSVRIGNNQTYLYYEKDKWFVECK